MDSILQELYHGMIHPEEEYQPTEECKQERKKLAAKQAELLEKMSKINPDMYAEMEGLFETENMVEAMELEEGYIQGMRLGARLVLALLGEQKKDRPSLA